MPADVAVIIVNFNAGPFLEAALASLSDGLVGLEWGAIVVDNGSSDGSERAAERADPRVRLLGQGANAGFARGANAGIAATSSPFVLFLNPDCRLESGSVRALMAEIERHPRCAAIGPRILDPDGTLQDSARGDPTLLTGLFGRSALLSRWLPWLPIVRRNLVAESVLRSGVPSQVVDWVSGACMLARREVLTNVGGFDNEYFLYWEDADLCRRMRNSGWHIRYMPAATVVHQAGQSSRSAPDLANREFHRSAFRYYVTHVVPQPWHPGRALAWLVLTGRAAVKRIWN